jgi:D-glycero-D-manno-heptose 1,7-bisphosphate phosphatase
MIKQAVILAGGLGTRLRPITDKIPKPMIQFHGKPFLEYLIELLKEQGIEEIILLLGYLSDKVVEHFGDGDEFGIKILYSISPVEDDTGLRIFKAKDIIKDEFLLLYCDNYWPLNLQKMYTKFRESQTDALVTIYGNKDGYTKSNCIVDKDDFLIVYDKSRQVSNLNGVDIGFFILKKEVLNLIPVGNVNFEKEVMPVLVGNKNIIAYKTDHRYYSVGSHERLLLTEKFLERRPTIILDRDGVLNKKAPKAEYITRIEEWEWIPGSLEAISLLKKRGYQIVVVTNQAGIARGKMTEQDLLQIHAKMNQDLSKVDAGIDKIYFCPHGWDENCECRKPKPGMLFNAQKDLHLDLSRTYFVGDDERDVEAGIAAGTKTFLLSADIDLLDFVKNYI